MPTPSLHTLNFTIFLENFIVVKRFNLRRSNTAVHASYLKRCNYHPVDHKTCPIFRIRDLLDIVEHNPIEQLSMLKYGGIIHISINWICDLDRPLDQCLPYYSFRRLDTRYEQEAFLAGFGFR